jgi:uncharacterized protein
MTRPCPICAKPMDEQYRPFCSRRCADVDLQRWFAESYALSGPPAEPEREDEGAAAGQPGRPPL